MGMLRKVVEVPLSLMPVGWFGCSAVPAPVAWLAWSAERIDNDTRARASCRSRVAAKHGDS